MYMYIYIYIYIYMYATMGVSIAGSGKDEGGPSKGGLLNHRLCSYTVLQLCNDINGLYSNDQLFMSIIDYSGSHLY